MPEWLTFSLIKDVLLALIAVYGATLATFNWRQTLRKDQRLIKLYLAYPHPSRVSQYTPRVVTIVAANAGHRSITVTAIDLEFENGRQIHARIAPYMRDSATSSDTKLPITLSDGQTATRTIPFQQIQWAHIDERFADPIILTPICVDSMGVVYRGNPWTTAKRELFTG